jgi:hypothetical protein
MPWLSVTQLTELAQLHEELLWVDGFSREMFKPQ